MFDFDNGLPWWLFVINQILWMLAIYWVTHND